MDGAKAKVWAQEAQEAERAREGWEAVDENVIEHCPHRRIRLRHHCLRVCRGRRASSHIWSMLCYEHNNLQKRAGRPKLVPTQSGQRAFGAPRFKPALNEYARNQFIDTNSKTNSSPSPFSDSIVHILIVV